MPRADRVLLILAALVSFGATVPAAAQQAGSASPPVRQTSTVTRVEEPKLIFEREVFVYPGADRRDPFKPIDKDRMGPMFEELTLRMIIHSEVPNQSVVVLADPARKVYRLRRGQTLGNSTVVNITPTRVVFVVEDYGNRRQEILDLKPKKEGA